MTKSNHSVSGGSFWAEQGAGSLLEVQGALVEDGLPMGAPIHLSRLQGVQHRHQAPSRLGSRIGWRTAADLAGDDRGPQVALGAGVLGGDSPVVSPLIEAVDMGPADVLEAMEAERLCWRLQARHELRLERGCLPGALGVRDGLHAAPWPG